MEETAAATESPSGSRVSVAPSTPVIGAEIAGVDLREPVSSELSAEFRRLLAQHKVLFFRDQELNTAQHVSFARSFGSILTFSGAREDHPEYPGVQIVPGKTSLPRSDATCMAAGGSSFSCRPAAARPAAVRMAAVSADVPEPAETTPPGGSEKRRQRRSSSSSARGPQLV